MKSDTPTPNEIEAMRQAVADHDAAVAKEADEKATAALQPARDFMDDPALADILEKVEPARIAVARFTQVASIIENIGAMIKILPDAIKRAEDVARGDALAAAKQGEA